MKKTVKEKKGLGERDRGDTDRVKKYCEREKGSRGEIEGKIGTV